MKCNVLKETVMSKAASVVRKMTNEDYYGWPPVCIGIMYQPVRPAHSAEDEAQANNN